MRAEPVRLLRTVPHPCGYFAGRVAQNLVIDPHARDLGLIFGDALRSGFRRAGEHVYRPACHGCRACVAARIPIAAFRPDRAQRRCLARNRDLEVLDAAPRIDEETFALYRRYLEARHPGGGMDDAEPVDFKRFVHSSWSNTRFLEFRLEGTLVAVAVTDHTPAGLSAVYTFFDPGLPTRGLGTFAILSQIEEARRLHLPHLYLGYWIASHPKMDYKARFRPLEVLDGGRWRALVEPCERAIPSASTGSHASADPKAS
jgi:arginine-tRNA-protein transferase